MRVNFIKVLKMKEKDVIIVQYLNEMRKATVYDYAFRPIRDLAISNLRDVFFYREHKILLH